MKLQFFGLLRVNALGKFFQLLFKPVGLAFKNSKTRQYKIFLVWVSR